ncbi:phenylacetate--CoA ligase family protein [Haladaptatus halobius]|uniref:phenylacetate--CoA ligase family protein n=1 Tax=Haladaptatus halobius TaxID=2884875 RepID=UPI001D0BDBA9|nr:AMP-binding protein [Haladaptatus halobius]
MSWPSTPKSDYRPDPSSEYWDAHQETRSPAERREDILEKINEQVRYAYDNSEFYREFYADVDINPRDITSFEEFEQLPILRSEDIKQEQKKHPPFGRFLCIDEEDIARVYGTSGTTGQPKVFGIGEEDWNRIGEWHAQILWSVGIRPDDRIIITSPFIQYLGSWGALAGVDHIGCTTFPFGAGMEGQTQQAVEWISNLQPDALYGTPSYALYLGETAKENGYIPAEDFSFKVMFFSGEPGASIPSTRQEIETMFDCEVIDQGSMAEMTPWMSNSGCQHLDNGMHVWNDIVYTELLDPSTEAHLEYGEEGVPTYTHLERTSQPMIRYWSGDITMWERHDETGCDCGRTYPTLPKGVYGRVDDMLVVRGKNIFPSEIEDQLHALDDFGDEFRIVVEKEGALDSLQLVVEIADNTVTSVDEFHDVVRTAIKSEVGVTPNVTIVPQGELDRTQFKADRVKDKRDLAVDI